MMVAQTALPARCRLLALGLLAAFVAGCTCSRVRINEGIEQLDSAWIIPGQTTFEEVITRLGLPPPAGKVDDVALYPMTSSIGFRPTPLPPSLSSATFSPRSLSARAPWWRTT